MEYPEKDLVLACQAGDAGAFQELVSRYKGRVYALAYGVLQDKEDALDVSQEAFIKIYREIKGFRHKSSFQTWLRRVVINLSIDHLRSRKSRKNVSEEGREGRAGQEEISSFADPGGTAEESCLRKEMAESVLSALGKLPPPQRTTLVLREFEGMSYSEISRVMRCSKGTVMSRLFYARRKLREELGSYLSAEE